MSLTFRHLKFFRVKGPLSNSVDFAAAYNCPEVFFDFIKNIKKIFLKGSPMNPIQKCKVW